MTARHASELLYDSEAALRLVDSAIDEIRQPQLSEILARGYAEVVSVLGSLRESRAVLQRPAVGALSQDVTTHQLDHASAVLTDMEGRLAMLASVLDPAALGVAVARYREPHGKA
jgi:hypothetical protein